MEKLKEKLSRLVYRRFLVVMQPTMDIELVVNSSLTVHDGILSHVLAIHFQ
jgi:hypothetical protein